MKKKTLWLTETAMLTALLIVFQAVTRSWGQFVTGSFVNAVLALSALTAGLLSGIVVAALSPFVAFLLGIGPQIFPVVPAIAVGNVVFVTVLWLLTKGRQPAKLRLAAAWVIPAVCKFLTLYIIVAQLLCRILPLKEQQIATLSKMFSWPQLVTALIGGAVALLTAPLVRRGIKTV